jgi:nucleotide-binding universal stress UspA family protein
MWTCPPSRILVPVDFSDASGRAVEVAVALARRTGARVHLLHVEAIEVPAYFTTEQMKALEREQAVARSRADGFLGEFATRHGASVFSTEIVEGLPTPTIVKAAGDTDLVVMGTHGRRGPALWWLGSVAERVIHESPAPVLVVRASTGTPPDDVFRHPMLLAGELTPEAHVARVAAELAKAVGGEVVPTAAACAADLAAERHASLIVLSSAARHGTLLSHPAEQWLRSCSLPMLFVPKG